MTILKHPKGYFTVSANLLYNKELTPATKYVMCVLYSLPQDWQYDLNELVEVTGIARETLRKHLEALRQKGYIKIIDRHVENDRDIFNYELFFEPHGDDIEECETPDKKAKKPPVVKHRRTERVFMSDANYESLIERFGVDGAKERIQRLSDYKVSTGKKYEDDYRTILNWERMHEERQKPKKTPEVPVPEYTEQSLDRFEPYWKEAGIRRGDMTKFGWSNKAVYQAAKQIDWNGDLEFEKLQFYLRLDGLV